MKALTVSLALVAGLLLQTPAAADTLLIERVQVAEGKTLPARGQSMAQVEQAYGAPTQKHAPVAGPGDREHNPPITRWVYPEFTVYFEHSHVIDAVLNKAHEGEVGPKPIQ
ncbi:MAG TPA: hypothetical protein VK016_03255 [Arenimonas sp.]|nr:hypothetical protein [Arenimonas sp.]